MQEAPLSLLFLILFMLIILSGFFSSSETGMMALNRYKLKHLANKGHKGARKAKALLAKPEQLIGVILIGNNFVNILASAIATLLALKTFGTGGIAIATGLLTLVILVFAEVTPKTFAAVHPEGIAFTAAHILTPLLKIAYPLVWLVNSISYRILRPLGIDTRNLNEGQLSREELRLVVNESTALIPPRHRSMLLSIFDLEQITVDDIMVPRNEIFGIDLEDDFDEIAQQLRSCQHTRIPIFKSSMNKPIAILHMRKWGQFLASHDEKNRANLMQYTVEPYFVLEGTPLHIQLSNFQKAKRRLGLVVDEYGDVKGMVTLEDILEEIVGEFTTDLAASSKDIHPQQDGSFIIDGTTTIRSINKALKWHLPTQGPKTLSGLIIEHLEFIPNSAVSLNLENYRIEVVQVKDNTVKTAKLIQHKDLTADDSDAN